LGSAITQHFQAFGLRNNIGGTKIHPFAQGHFSTANIIIANIPTMVCYSKIFTCNKYSHRAKYLPLVNIHNSEVL
jgi:hypothetical protein